MTTPTSLEVPPTASLNSRLIAAEVRAEAARRGLSRRQLSMRMGVRYPWLARRIGMTADVDITFEDLAEMAKALGTSSERLLLAVLPRLDSNQQPSGYVSPQVRALPTPLAPVIRLSDHRVSRAS